MNMRIVLTTGCYDLLHVGHLRHLEECRGFGDYLVVGVNSDESVHRLKGAGRPLVSAEDRAALVRSLKCVDEVRVFDEDTPLQLIKEIRPDVLAAGCDYSPETIVGRDVVEGYGGQVRMTTAPRTLSTTDLIRAICDLVGREETKHD